MRPLPCYSRTSAIRVLAGTLGLTGLLMGCGDAPSAENSTGDGPILLRLVDEELLPDSEPALQAGIENAGLCPQVGFQGMHAIRFEEVMQRIIFHWIFQVAEYARPGRTDLDASRFQAARDSMITERALLRDVSDRIHEPAAVGTGLDAETAADAILWIDQYGSIRRVKCRPYRADLGAR